MTDPWETPWRARYAELQARRAASGAPMPATLDQVRDLAAAGADTPERIALLDAVLADPRTRDEYLLLRELGRADRRPAAARTRAARSLAAAAMLAAVLGAGALWRLRREGPEPMRGDAPAVEVVAPAADAGLAPGTRFVWRAVPRASAYVLEIADDAGASVLSRRLADTTFTLPAAVEATPAGALVWWVTAELPGGQRVRSTPRALTAP